MTRHGFIIISALVTYDCIASAATVVVRGGARLFFVDGIVIRSQTESTAPPCIRDFLTFERNVITLALQCNTKCHILPLTNQAMDTGSRVPGATSRWSSTGFLRHRIGGSSFVVCVNGLQMMIFSFSRSSETFAHTSPPQEVMKNCFMGRVVPRLGGGIIAPNDGNRTHLCCMLSNPIHSRERSTRKKKTGLNEPCSRRCFEFSAQNL